MLVQKYKYHNLSKKTENGKRLYQTPGGEKLPSVTTILDATKSEESKQALQNWRNRVGHKQAQAITTEAAGRGTRMHTYLEKYIQNQQLSEPGSNPYAKQSHTMAQVIIQNGLVNVSEIWGIETPLYFPKIYAGTADSIGVHKNQESIIDYKQSNKEKKREWIEDYFLQLAAYGTAHNELYGTNIRKGVIFMCVKPRVDEQFNIIDAPKYLEFVIEGTEYDKYVDLWWKRLELFYSSL